MFNIALALQRNHLFAWTTMDHDGPAFLMPLKICYLERVSDVDQGYIKILAFYLDQWTRTMVHGPDIFSEFLRIWTIIQFFRIV